MKFIKEFPVLVTGILLALSLANIWAGDIAGAP